MNIAARHPAGELLDPRAKWPKDWRKVRLAEVADMRLGKMLDAQKNKGSLFRYLANPNVRWFELDLNNLKEMRFEKEEEEKFSIRNGDVLVCEGGEAGRAAIWKGPDAGVKFQKAIHRVRPKEALLNRFLVHRLFYDYHKGNLNDYYTGATIKHLTGQDLARYEFVLPPLDEQKRIAAILDQADTLRRLRQRAIDRLNALGQAIFQASLRTAILTPVKLGEVCSPKQHKTIPIKELRSHGYPVFGANGQIGFYHEFTHEKPTIAITCRGATCGTINITPANSYITGNAMALDDLDGTKIDLRYLGVRPLCPVARVNRNREGLKGAIAVVFRRSPMFSRPRGR